MDTNDKKIDKKIWADYGGPLRAALDEYAKAVLELGVVVAGVSQERYVGRTELSDESFENVADIMRHVLGAAHVYVDYLDDAISRTDRGPQEHVYDVTTADLALDALHLAFSRMVVALGVIRGASESELSDVRFTVRWGTEYDIEQMIEHAIVHILRHRRQIEIWLKLEIV